MSMLSVDPPILPDFASDAYRMLVLQDLHDRMVFTEYTISPYSEFSECWFFRAQWPPPPGELSARRVWAMTRILTAWLHETFGEPSDVVTETAWSYRIRGWHSPTRPGGIDVYFNAQSDVAKFRLFFDAKSWKPLSVDF